MRVAARLNLAILPAVVGLVVMASLAYWGDRGRQAPGMLVALTACATVASALLSWRATRVVSAQVGQLAADVRALGLDGAMGEASDEFEELALVRESVRALIHDQAQLRDRTAMAVRESERDRQQRSAVLEQLAVTVSAQLEEARLALHILQTSPFGELNENQEELVGAARLAADTADRELRRFTRLVTMSMRRRAATRESVAVGALLEPAVATCTAIAEDRRIGVQRNVPPDLPPVLVDRLASQEALTLLLQALAEASPTERDLTIEAEEGDGEILLRLRPGLPAASATALPVLLAGALLEAQSGYLDVWPDQVSLRLPTPPSTVWRTAARSVR